MDSFVAVVETAVVGGAIIDVVLELTVGVFEFSVNFKCKGKRCQKIHVFQI